MAIVVAIPVGAQLLGMATLYHFQSDGITVRPLQVFYVQLSGWTGRPWWNWCTACERMSLCLAAHASLLSGLPEIRDETWIVPAASQQAIDRA